MIIYIGFLLAHVRSRDGAQDQENAPMSPWPSLEPGLPMFFNVSRAKNREGLVDFADVMDVV